MKKGQIEMQRETERGREAERKEGCTCPGSLQLRRLRRAHDAAAFACSQRPGGLRVAGHIIDNGRLVVADAACASIRLRRDLLLR